MESKEKNERNDKRKLKKVMRNGPEGEIILQAKEDVQLISHDHAKISHSHAKCSKKL